MVFPGRVGWGDEIPGAGRSSEVLVEEETFLKIASMEAAWWSQGEDPNWLPLLAHPRPEKYQAGMYIFSQFSCSNALHLEKALKQWYKKKQSYARKKNVVTLAERDCHYVIWTVKKSKKKRWQELYRYANVKKCEKEEKMQGYGETACEDLLQNVFKMT